jgi:hypothetical protein
MRKLGSAFKEMVVKKVKQQSKENYKPPLSATERFKGLRKSSMDRPISSKEDQKKAQQKKVKVKVSEKLKKKLLAFLR